MEIFYTPPAWEFLAHPAFGMGPMRKRESTILDGKNQCSHVKKQGEVSAQLTREYTHREITHNICFEQIIIDVLFTI